MGLWTGHRYKEPILQGGHAMWSLGAATGPFIIGRFLVELPPRNTTTDVENLPVSDAADVVNTAVTSSSIRSAGGTLIIQLCHLWECCMNF